MVGCRGIERHHCLPASAFYSPSGSGSGLLAQISCHSMTAIPLILSPQKRLAVWYSRSMRKPPLRLAFLEQQPLQSLSSQVSTT